MTLPPSAPGQADWLAGLLRGLHPIRWLLCLAGLALTGLSAALAQSWFDNQPPPWADCWQRPGELAQALAAEAAGRPLGGVVLRLAPLLAVTAAGWCLVGGWVARHELLARRGAGPGTDLLGPTELVTRQGKGLLLCCPLALCVTLVLLLPALVAGWLSAWGAALVVAVLLPVLLVACVALLVVAAGAVAWPLMAVAIAAECGDAFDGMSRAYSYAYQRPLLFLLLTAVALGLAGLPLAAVLYPLADTLAAQTPQVRQWVLWLAAGLSASIFWSLETLVYLHLRASVDGVDAGAVAAGPEKPPAEAKAAGQPAPGHSQPAVKWGPLTWALHALVLAAASWYLMVWLIWRASGEQTEWLNWGLGERFVPAVTGLPRVASLIAGGWGVLLAGMILWMTVRRLLRADDAGPTR